MTSDSKSSSGSAERRLAELGITLPAPPTPFGAYVEAVQTGNLLFLTGMLPTVGHKAAYIGRVGRDFDEATAYKAARIAALNALAVTREHLGSLDKVARVVRLGVYIATAEPGSNYPKIADGASELFRDVFGTEKLSSRLVIGVANLPLDVPIELEVIFEVDA